MSIHHYVSVHCDGVDCGEWQDGDAATTTQRRKDGWTIWTEGGRYGRRRHLCPRCTREGRKTLDGLAANEVPA